MLENSCFCNYLINRIWNSFPLYIVFMKRKLITDPLHMNISLGFVVTPNMRNLFIWAGNTLSCAEHTKRVKRKIRRKFHLHFVVYITQDWLRIALWHAMGIECHIDLTGYVGWNVHVPGRVTDYVGWNVHVPGRVTTYVRKFVGKEPNKDEMPLTFVIFVYI